MNLIKSILIANRGEIAVRIIRTCKNIGIKTIAIYTKFDYDSLHVQIADEAYFMSGDNLSDNYLNIRKIVQLAKACKAQAVHPGYGFLSENHNFAEYVEKNDLIFIGPHSKTIRQMGNKILSRQIMNKNKVPTILGSEALHSLDDALAEANNIKYPLIIKSALGGGGRGMRIVESEKDLRRSFSITQKESLLAFGSDEIYMEQFLSNPKHIEVQILADNFKNTVAFVERDCSVQRKNQKIIEETPSFNLPNSIRNNIINTSINVAKSVNYVNAGTIEFLMDNYYNYYFMEMNTRIQVEHPITEMVSGLDIIEMQIRIASNQKLKNNKSFFSFHGHSIESRIYAETPDYNFFPVTGCVNYLHVPGGVNVKIDSGVVHKTKITPYYDPMLMKVSVWGLTRKYAISRMIGVLKELIISGCITNIAFLINVLKFHEFVNGTYGIKVIEAMQNQKRKQRYFTSHIICATVKVYNINTYLKFKL